MTTAHNAGTPPAERPGFAESMAELAVALTVEQQEAGSPTLAQQIVAGAVAVIPGVLAAAVETVNAQGLLEAPVMEGQALVEAIMGAQNESRQGPCLQAWEQSRQTVLVDIASDSRWPAFAALATGHGARSVVSTPITVQGRRLGILSLMGTGFHFADQNQDQDQDQDQDEDEDEDVETMARIFAAHAGVALTGARKLEEVQQALDSRDVIGQAKGMLMERFGVTPDVAFAMLVRTSANTNTKLRRVADELCLTGVWRSGTAKRPD